MRSSGLLRSRQGPECDAEIGQRGAGQLGREVVVGEREQRGAHLAEQDQALERAEDQHQPEARRALGIGVRDLLAAREQERAQARDHVVREALLARLELRVRVVAHDEGAHQAAPLPEDRHQEVDDRAGSARRSRAPSQRAGSERRVGGGDGLLVVALVEGVEQAVLVVEARIEGARPRSPRAARSRRRGCPRSPSRRPAPRPRRGCDRASPGCAPGAAAGPSGARGRGLGIRPGASIGLASAFRARACPLGTFGGSLNQNHHSGSVCSRADGECQRIRTIILI